MYRAPENIRFTKEVFVENDEPAKIDSLQFSILSADEIKKASLADVYRGVYYDMEKKPIPNGLLEPKLGPANKISRPCATCHGSFTDCPGHYGSLTLELPVFHNGYLGVIVDILKCICKDCSHILLNEKDRRDLLKKMRNPILDPQRKIEAKKKMVQQCSNKLITCFRCGYPNGKVKKGTGLIIIHDIQRMYDSDEEQTKTQRSSASRQSFLDPVKVLWLFKRMQDQDCELFYLNGRPETLLITCLAVPPIALRPSVFVDGGMSNENDITERLKRIIQANACVKRELEESSTLSRALLSWDHLQIEVAQYINSEARVGSSPADKPTKPLSGLIQRLKGKKGRFRGNLSGKRVEFTGRTVISPDPNLKITEVAVPQLMATILTYPERVTRHNIEKLKHCVCNGPKKYPGAKFITDTSANKRDLSFVNRKRVADELKLGYIVDRHLENGDAVLFNRQPSLHRMSIMCHRAKIMPWRTLRFNESVCNPYNADFDGDEMNLHVPQSEEARTEALLLMGVQNNLCTPKSGSILVASTQDFLTSSFLITRKDTFYDRGMFSLLCCYMGDGMDLIDLPAPALIKPIELWTGKQLFNVLLRPHAGMRVFVNLMAREANFCKQRITCEDETMCPADGFVYFRNSELICGQLGKRTLGNGNKIGLYSVLLRDYNAHAAAACMTRLSKLSARWIGDHGFSIGVDDVQPGNALDDAKRRTILSGYEKCDDLISSYKKGKLELLPGCDAAGTLESKITGTLNKIRNDASTVCMDGLHWRNSPLIMSQCGSKGSKINIAQMVACVGQQVVGGARAPNGFIDRSLPLFPRNSKTPDAKGFVANSFYSGLTATEFFFHTMGGREGLVDTAVKTADTGYMSRRLMKCLEDLSVQYDLTVRNASGNIVQFFYGDDGMDPSQMEGSHGISQKKLSDGKSQMKRSDDFPVDLDRLRLKVEATCPAGNSKMLSSSELLDYIKQKLDIYETSKDTDGNCSHAFVKLQEYVNKELVSKNVRLTEQQLQVFMDTFDSCLRSKRIEAGTAIGAIGAQSIGEPGTQMTLKTFHFAGVGSKNVTLGVPRIKEIINASKKISTPIIIAQLVENDKKIAESVRGCIEITTLAQVSKSIKLEMTSVGASVVVKLDMEKITGLRINTDIVKEKIEASLKKRKDIKNLNVKVIDDKRLSVVPEAEKSCLHFILHWLKNRLAAIVVKGINTVERAVVSDKEKNGKKTGELELVVEGTGLLQVMGMDGVDGPKTKSNNVIEVWKTLGIEAARNCIIKEIKRVMKGHDIDIRHMMLLADLMTSQGEVLAISRTGMTKMKESVLMLASFEKTADHLFNASVTGRVDKVEGVSESIIMGVPMRLGTGILKVIHRSQVLPQLTYKSDPIIC